MYKLTRIDDKMVWNTWDGDPDSMLDICRNMLVNKDDILLEAYQYLDTMIKIIGMDTNNVVYTKYIKVEED